MYSKSLNEYCLISSYIGSRFLSLGEPVITWTMNSGQEGSLENTGFKKEKVLSLS